MTPFALRDDDGVFGCEWVIEWVTMLTGVNFKIGFGSARGREIILLHFLFYTTAHCNTTITSHAQFHATLLSASWTCELEDDGNSNGQANERRFYSQWSTHHVHLTRTTRHYKWIYNGAIDTWHFSWNDANAVAATDFGYDDRMIYSQEQLDALDYRITNTQSTSVLSLAQWAPIAVVQNEQLCGRSAGFLWSIEMKDVTIA